MLKKCICFLTCISVMFLCLPVFSSASVAEYSDLPEPVPTDNIKYFVIGVDSSHSLYMVSCAIPITVSIGIDNNLVTVVCALNESGFVPTLTAYRLNNETLSVNSFNMTRVGSTNIFQYKFSNFPVDSRNVTLSSYGCMFSSGFNLQPCNIVWNDSVNPSTYTNILNNINSKLNEIDTNTDGIEAALADINSELELFYNLFNAYKSAILEDTTNIQTLLNTVITRLNSFASQNHTDLVNILNKLNQIYNLLNQEEPTRAPAIENEDEVNDVLQNEAALNKDFSGDLNQQFNVAGNIFDSNSSFSFISNLFQELVLDVPALNSLIIFSLAIGLCVLILGRRLNA